MDDIHQTTIYMSYDDGGEQPDDEQQRMEAYMAAWTTCLERVKGIIEELYSPVVADILEGIQAEVVPGLPFPELPVIAVADVSGGSVFLDGLCANLEDTIVSHMYPTDCPNLTSGMKTLIGGFVDASKRRPAASLAAYDIGVLQAWFDDAQHTNLRLLVLVHDFEKFDKAVLQDMLYICSLQVARLPLTFLLSLSTPSPSSSLHASLTRATLARLRVYHFTVPAGPSVLEAVVLKTLFDPAVDLPLLPGAALLSFISDYCATHSASLPALLSILHLAHLKHYTAAEPLSFLAHSTPPVSSPPTPRDLAFLDLLLARLHPSWAPNAHTWREHASTPERLLHAVDAARTAFTCQAQRTRLGVTLLVRVVAFLRAHMNPDAAQTKRLKRWSSLAFISRILNNTDEDVTLDGFADLLRTVPAAELDALLKDLSEYLDALPLAVTETTEEADARQQITDFRARIDDSSDEIASWVEEYLGDLLLQSVLEDATPLYGIWYTGLTPFPSELLNPALRPSIISGLLHPHSYAAPEKPQEADEEQDLPSLPDTSILFAGYARAGKLVNVYDWFDHFRVVLEQQRRAARAPEMQMGTSSAKGKGKGKAEPPSSPRKGKTKAPKDEEDEEDEEKWRLRVQARFIRALHELDYLGFIKHTGRGGRKGEYVLRTVLGVLD